LEQAPAQAEDPQEPVLVPPRGLVAVTLAVLLLTAGLAVVVAPPVQPPLLASLVLDAWQPAADERDAMVQRDDALLRAWHLHRTQLGGQQFDAIFARFLAFLAVEQRIGADGIAQDEAARKSLGELEEAVRTLVLTAGSDALRALAVSFGRQVRDAVQIAVKAAGKRQQRLESFLGTQPQPPEAANLSHIAGGIGSALVAAGVGHGSALTDVEGLLVQALAQQRVFDLAVRLPQPAPELPSDLQRMLLRFRVEAMDHADLTRKLQLLRELERVDPTYPAAYARGVLAARAQRCDLALPAFAEAMRAGQSPRQASINARWCRERMAQ